MEEKGRLPGADLKTWIIWKRKEGCQVPILPASQMLPSTGSTGRLGPLAQGTIIWKYSTWKRYFTEIFHRPSAEAFGLKEGDVVVAIHCGSRALGHQIGTDYLQVLGKACKKYQIPIRLPSGAWQGLQEVSDPDQGKGACLRPDKIS